MLTAIILTKNESENISACLSTLNFADEILVIDDYSSDSTPSIAASMGAKVISHYLNNNFAQGRNFALSQAHSDWVLFVDADERVPSSLADEILHTINSPRYSGYYLHRLDFLWGKCLRFGDTGNCRLLRLGKKSAGSWNGQVHETWQIKGATSNLVNPLHHYPHRDLYAFLKSINYYSTIRAVELQTKSIPSGVMRIVFQPILKFFHLYLFKLGILDGNEGLIHALTMSFYTFLVQGKLYLRASGSKFY